MLRPRRSANCQKTLWQIESIHFCLHECTRSDARLAAKQVMGQFQLYTRLQACRSIETCCFASRLVDASKHILLWSPRVTLVFTMGYKVPKHSAWASRTTSVAYINTYHMSASLALALPAERAAPARSTGRRS